MATGRVPTTANSPLTAKGDLFGYSTTQARVPVGNDGETIVADSSTATGLKWAAPSTGATSLGFTAGKNKIINGDFGIWQRGTSFSAQGYLADRFRTQFNGSGATRTMSQQTFTAGTAPVTGYEGQYFFRYDQSVAGSGGSYNTFEQYIEDVRTFANQTATFSFWAKASSSVTITGQLSQNFGSGGSGTVDVTAQNAALTTSWQRFTLTFSVPSVSGKTIGTGSALRAILNLPLNTTYTIDTWGWQLEAGSTATAFQTATGTIQGELAACQRYYQRLTGDANQVLVNYAFCSNSTLAIGQYQYIVPMRTVPTSLDFSNVRFRNHAGSTFNMSSIAFNEASAFAAQIYGTISGGTAEQPGSLLASATTGFIGLSAEL